MSSEGSANLRVKVRQSRVEIKEGEEVTVSCRVKGGSSVTQEPFIRFIVSKNISFYFLHLFKLNQFQKPVSCYYGIHMYM